MLTPKYTPVTLLLKGGLEYTVTVEAYRIFCEDFPTVDVVAELRAMRAWLRANPQRRKTPRGVNTFICKWLSRAKDRAPVPQKGVTYAASHKPMPEGIERTSEADKLAAEKQLAKMQAQIERRKANAD